MPVQLGPDGGFLQDGNNMALDLVWNFSRVVELFVTKCIQVKWHRLAALRRLQWFGLAHHRSPPDCQSRKISALVLGATMRTRRLPSRKRSTSRSSVFTVGSSSFLPPRSWVPTDSRVRLPGVNSCGTRTAIVCAPFLSQS